MNDMIFIGSITGPFGLKGEVKVYCESNHQDKIFNSGMTFYIDDNPYVIKNAHIHKNNYLVLFEGVNDIKDIDNILKKEIYIRREDLNLKDGEYLTSELFGLTIKDSEKNIGIVKEILYNKNNFFIKCDNLIIPLNEKYIEKVDITKQCIYVKDIQELIL